MFAEFEVYLDQVKNEVTSILLESGEVPLTGILLKQRCQPLIIPLYMIEKQEIPNLLSKLVKDSAADGIILFFEAWYVDRPIPENEEAPNLTPSECPDRKDCIMVLYKDKEFKEVSKIYPFTHKDKEISFQDSFDMSPEQSYNRFLSKVFSKPKH